MAGKRLVLCKSRLGRPQKRRRLTGLFASAHPELISSIYDIGGTYLRAFNWSSDSLIADVMWLI